MVQIGLFFGLISFKELPRFAEGPMAWLVLALAPMLVLLPAAGLALYLRWHSAAAGVFLASILVFIWGSQAWRELGRHDEAASVTRATPRDDEAADVYMWVEPRPKP